MDVNYILKLIPVFIIMSLITYIFVSIFDRFQKDSLVEFCSSLFYMFTLIAVIYLIIFIIAKICGY